jgi:YVTN family beta-propeller protein
MKNAKSLFVKHIHYFCLIAALALGLATVLATGGGGGDGSNEYSTEYDARGTIGPEGGVVEVTDPDSPAYGAKIVVPDGALNEEVTFTITTATKKAPAPEDFSSGYYINFEADGTFFNHSIECAIPYIDSDNDGMVDGTNSLETELSVYTYVSNSKSWNRVPVISQDLANNLLFIETDHFSQYLASTYQSSNYCWPVYENDKVVIYNILPENNGDSIFEFAEGISSALATGLIKKLLAIPSIIGIITSIISEIPVCGEDPTKIRVGLVFDGYDALVEGSFNNFNDISSTIARPIIGVVWSCCPWVQSQKIVVNEKWSWPSSTKLYEQLLLSEDEMNTYMPTLIIGKQEIDFCSMDAQLSWDYYLEVESPGICSSREEEPVRISEAGLDEECNEYPNKIVDTVSVGDFPKELAVSPTGQYVYVTNWFGNSVSVIQTIDNSVIKTIPTSGIHTCSVAVRPDGSYVYVTIDGGVVDVIRTSDNTVIDTIYVGLGAIGIAATPPDGNYVYVASEGTDTVSVIRTSDNVVTQQITVGARPHHLAITPDGNYVYVANNADKTVSVIQTSTNTVIDNITVGGNPYDICISKNGIYAYVSLNSDDIVQVIQLSDNSVIKTIPVGDNPLALDVSPGGRYVYVSSLGDGNISIIDTIKGSVIDTIYVGNSPEGVRVTPDGKYVYVTNRDADTVSVIGKSN